VRSESSTALQMPDPVKNYSFTTGEGDMFYSRFPPRPRNRADLEAAVTRARAPQAAGSDPGAFKASRLQSSSELQSPSDGCPCLDPQQTNTMLRQQVFFNAEDRPITDFLLSCERAAQLPDGSLHLAEEASKPGLSFSAEEQLGRESAGPGDRALDIVIQQLAEANAAVWSFRAVTSIAGASKSLFRASRPLFRAWLAARFPPHQVPADPLARPSEGSATIAHRSTGLLG
jgi:hypothetical protein